MLVYLSVIVRVFHLTLLSWKLTLKLGSQRIVVILVELWVKWLFGHLTGPHLQLGLNSNEVAIEAFNLNKILTIVESS